MHTQVCFGLLLRCVLDAKSVIGNGQTSMTLTGVILIPQVCSYWVLFLWPSLKSSVSPPTIPLHSSPDCVVAFCLFCHACCL